MAMSDQQTAMAATTTAARTDGLHGSCNGAPVDPVPPRADLLLNCVQMLHAHLDVPAVVTSLAARVQELLEVEMVAVLLRRNDRFTLEAVGAADVELNAAIHAAQGQGKFRLFEDLAARAHLTAEPVVFPLAAHDPECPGFTPPGHFLAAAMRSADANGAIVIYRSGLISFTSDEKSIISAVASVGALAVSNAELYARANERSRELQQLLEITSELGSIGRLSEFLGKFVVRAAEFLGFERSFIALCEENHCHIRWISEQS